MGSGNSAQAGQPKVKQVDGAPPRPSKGKDKQEKEKKIDVPTPGTLAKERQRYLKAKPALRKDPATGLPEPAPPLLSKEEVFDVDQYRDIDRHATQAPSELLHGTFQELIDYLLRFAQTDMEKARVIFRWLAAQDLGPITQATGTRKDSPLQWLKDCKLYWKDYFEVVQKLYDSAGIPCKSIQGRLKAAQYVLGSEDTMVINGWNAILIDGTWRLLNARWACVAVKGAERPVSPSEYAKKEKAPAETTEQTFYGRCDEKFWLSDPHMMIYTHLPDEPKWQMTATPINMDQFCRMAYLRAEFFEHKLDIGSDPQETIVATNGVASFDLRTSPGAIKSFSYRLRLREGTVWDREIETYAMERFVFVEQIEDIVSFEIRCPAKGMYLFEIYCKDLKVGDSYVHVMTYRIQCHSPKVLCRPYPKNAGREWGPGHHLAASKLLPLSSKYAKVDVDEGIFEAKFRMEDSGHDKEFFHTLENIEISSNKLKHYVLYNKHGDEVSFHVKMPAPGEYALNVHVRDRRGHRWVMCYLIETKVGALNPRPFPPIDGSRTGILPLAAGLVGLEPSGHTYSYYHVSKEHNLNFKYEKPCVFTFKLTMQNKLEEEFSHFCKQEQIAENEMRFDFRFPRIGIYQFRLFGQPLTGNRQNAGPQLMAVYILDCSVPDVGVLPFPVMSPEFAQQGYRLLRPQEQFLIEHTSYSVVVDAVKTSMPLAIEKERRGRGDDADEGFFQQMETSAQRYAASIDTGPPGKLKLVSPQANGQNALVLWQVVTQEKLEQMARKAAEDYKRELQELTEAQRLQKQQLEERLKEARVLMDEQEQGDDQRRAEAEAKAEYEEMEYRKKWDRMNQTKDVRRNAMRTRMRKAIIMEDKKRLLKEILEYKTLFGADCGHEELEESENFLSFLDCRMALNRARHGGHYTELKIAMDAVRDNGFAARLAPEMQDAEIRLAELEEIHKLACRVMRLEPRTLCELKNYTVPPSEVHQMVIAVMLLLAIPEDVTATWKGARPFVTPYGKNSLIARIQSYDQTSLTGEIWARVQELITPIQRKGGGQFSAAATAIFRWAIGVQLQGEKKFGRTNPRPANIDRQHEIFAKQQEQAEQELRLLEAEDQADGA